MQQEIKSSAGAVVQHAPRDPGGRAVVLLAAVCFSAAAISHAGVPNALAEAWGWRLSWKAAASLSIML